MLKTFAICLFPQPSTSLQHVAKWEKCMQRVYHRSRQFFFKYNFRRNSCGFVYTCAASKGRGKKILLTADATARTDWLWTDQESAPWLTSVFFRLFSFFYFELSLENLFWAHNFSHCHLLGQHFSSVALHMHIFPHKSRFVVCKAKSIFGLVSAVVFVVGFPAFVNWIRVCEPQRLRIEPFACGVSLHWN